MIRIGYACINTQLLSPNRTCRLANATPERVVELARLNLHALGDILHWNHQHRITLFRISSEIIPLASHPAVRVDWRAALSAELEQVSGLVRDYGMRVSMHPGQYTVLSSPRPEVVIASLAELEYHARFLDALVGADASHKLVLHLGGVYGDKQSAMQRFAQAFALLSESARRRLVLENDEKNYTVQEALQLSGEIGTPVVFDVFHHAWNPSLEDHSLNEIVHMAAATWSAADGPPKLHYSNQWPGKPPGAHSQTVDTAAFGEFLNETMGDLRADVMLEVKDKEQSVLRLYEAYPALRQAAPLPE
jgi:UV DNA damage endonuclease